MRIFGAVTAASLLAICSALTGQPVAGSAPASSAPRSFPLGPTSSLAFAGISIALPKDLTPEPATDESSLFRLVDKAGEQTVLAVTLTVMPVKATATVDSLLRATDPTASLNFSNVKELRRQNLQVAGLQGRVQLLSYTCRKLDLTAVRLAMARPVGQSGMQMGYILTVEALSGHGREILPLLASMAASIGLSDPVSLRQDKVELAPMAISADRWGIGFRPPAYWKCQSSADQTLIVCYQMDYTVNQPGARATLAVRQAPAGSVDEILQKFMDELQADVEKHKINVKVVRQGQAGMGELPGRETVIAHYDEQGKLTDAMDHRMVVRGGLLYTLEVLYVGDSIDAAQRTMQTLAEGVKFSVPTAPASAAPAAPEAGPGGPPPGGATSTSAPASAAATPPAGR
jgi:hypothetical protein